MSLTITSEDVLFGPPTSLTFKGVELGASEDPAKFAVKITRMQPEFQGAAGPIAGLTRITKIEASLTVKLNELSLAKLQWALQNVTALVGTAATKDGGASTTLSADVAADATSIAVTLATNIAAGDFLKVGDADALEIATVDASYVSGTTIPLAHPLVFAHDSGDAVLETVDAGTTVLTQRIGMVSAAQHGTVIMQAIGPDGNPVLLTLTNALNTADVECSFGDTGTAGTPVTFTGYCSKSDPTLAPYIIEKLAAD